MKATLYFDLSNALGAEEHSLALKSSRLCSALHEVRNEIFRPARKHGYSDDEVRALVEKNPKLACALIAELERLFSEILAENGLSEFEI